MTGFMRIDAGTIREALEAAGRQYLVGDLRQPQQLTALPDTRLEIGVTSYSTAGSELEHFHTEVTEYQYVISGWTQYLDTSTDEVHDFVQGDFYAIAPLTRYAQRSKAGTVILFAKAPSVNDKVPVDSAPRTLEWLADRPRTVRIDYFHDDTAPEPNSLRPAAAVFIQDERERVLLLRRADSGNWTLPGGTLELDESLTACAAREVREETGLAVRITDIVATYTDPDVRIAYSDGEVRREFTILFAGRADPGPVDVDSESTGYGWFSFAELDGLPLAASQRRRLQDCRGFSSTGRRNLS